MSQARVHRAEKARKEWTCGKCRTLVKVGEPVLSYSVGFRGREQRRCTKTSCYPTRAELESSLVSSAYDAIDSADFTSALTLEDLQAVMQDIAGGIREVAEEYEGSTMFDNNEDLQQRAELLNSAADEVEGWDPADEPEKDNPDEWDGNVTFEEAHASWLEASREDAQQVVDEVELP